MKTVRTKQERTWPSRLLHRDTLAPGLLFWLSKALPLRRPSDQVRTRYWHRKGDKFFNWIHPQQLLRTGKNPQYGSISAPRFPPDNKTPGCPNNLGPAAPNRPTPRGDTTPRAAPQLLPAPRHSTGNLRRSNTRFKLLRSPHNDATNAYRFLHHVHAASSGRPQSTR